MGGQACSCASRSPCPNIDKAPEGAFVRGELLQRFPSVEWEGFGCSLSWLGKAFGSLKNPSQAEAWADVLFTMKGVGVERIWQDEMWLEAKPVPGLGLSIARYNVGGCGAKPGENLSELSLGPHAEIEGFQPSYKGKFIMSRDSAQMRFLKMAIDRGVQQVEVFSRAPMWWMSSSKSSFGGSLASPIEFSNYLAEVALHFRDKLHLPLRSVAPFTEPSVGTWEFPAEHECCNISVEEQVAFMRTLRSDLDRRGLQDVIIAASDERTPASAIETWRRFRSATVGETVGRINVHSYDDTDRIDRTALSHLARDDDVGLWVSEYSNEEEDGILVAQKIIADLNFLGPSAWCYWQPVEDRKSFGCVDVKFGDGYVDVLKMPHPKLYVLAHFTRFLRPGFRLLRLQSSEVRAIGGYSKESSALVAVLLNDAAESTSVKLVIPSYTTKARWASAVFTQPRQWEFLVNRPIQIQESNGVALQMHIHMPPYSVCSLYVENVVYSNMSVSSLNASWVAELAGHAGRGAARDRFYGAEDPLIDMCWCHFDHKCGVAEDALEVHSPYTREHWLRGLQRLRSLVCNEAWAAANECKFGGRTSAVKDSRDLSSYSTRENNFSEELILVIRYTCQAAANTVYHGQDCELVKAKSRLAAHYIKKLGSKEVISLG